MRSILALAKVTCLEGLRNRALYGIFLFAMFAFAMNITVAGFFMRDIGKVTVDMNLSALSFSGMLLTFFMSVNLMSLDLDKKTIHLVLSKPVTRLEYVVGKFLGIQAFVTVALLFLAVFSCATVLTVRYGYSEYFNEFSWISFLLAIVFIIVKVSVMISLVVMFSCLATSSFVTLIFSVAAYIIGETIEDVVFYLQSAVEGGEVVLSETVKFVIGTASYLLPNLSMFDLGLEAAHGIAVSVGRVGLSLAYALSYVAIVLILATVAFSRREFN